MLKLYVVRHGETEFNVQKRMQGRLDSPLSPKGIQNAMALSRHLAHIEFDKIYSSPSQRAYRTAELIRGTRTTEIFTENDLREMNLADWEGKTREELERLYPVEYDIFWHSPQLYKPKKGDGFQQVQDRAIGLLNKLIADNATGNLLLVTHSVVIKTMVAYYRNYPMEKLWEPPLIRDTSVTIVSAEEGVPKLEAVGDIAHLTKE